MSTRSEKSARANDGAHVADRSPERTDGEGRHADGACPTDGTDGCLESLGGVTVSDEERELPAFDLLCRFERHLSRERSLSPNTVRAYITDLLDFLRWCSREDVEPLNASAKRLRHYSGTLMQAGYTRTTTGRRLSALRTFYTWLNVIGASESNPAAILKNPKGSKTLPKTISSEDMDHLLDARMHVDAVRKGASSEAAEPSAKNLRDMAVLELLYGCGARVSEVAGLTLDDVDFAQGLITLFGKGSKERIVPIHEVALDAMRRYLDEGRPQFAGATSGRSFFLSSRGNPLSADAIRRIYKKALRESGVDSDFTPHAMRHSFATDVLTGGADLRAVQELLGHASLSTTQIYTHISPDRLKLAHSSAHPRGTVWDKRHRSES